jgi:hypothetical protein
MSVALSDSRDVEVSSSGLEFWLPGQVDVVIPSIINKSWQSLVIEIRNGARLKYQVS